MRSFVSCKLTEHDAILVLNAVSGFGIKRIRTLIERFGSLSAALQAPIEEFISFPGIPQASRINLQTFNAQAFLEKDRAACAAFGATALTFHDDHYPMSLHDIPDPPAVIYVAGDFPAKLDCSIAIVGSRRATLYGLKIAGDFATGLAELGIPVVSGVARGVDAAAHRGALRAGGATVGVLGCGLDVIYPLENKDLYLAIRKNGCLISEFPFGTLPLPSHFPRRNRIVSGLSLGIVVVEAGLKSGALVTAGFALEQGREVFAVPGRIDSAMSDGSHTLIQQGAKAVLSIRDILEDLPLEILRPKGSGGETEDDKAVVRGLWGDEKVIFDFIKEGITTYEALEARTGFSTTTLLAALLALELRGKIIQKPGRIYVLGKRADFKGVFDESTQEG
ncbi:MAG: DNA-processing protein DprA [Candidatus Omnitrophota bacterium]